MKKRQQYFTTGLLVLLFFSVFAVCILLVLLNGADAYQRLTERGQSSYERRTVAQYLRARVHQADTAGGIFVGSFNGDPAGTDTLFLVEIIDGETYCTRIYCRNGMLMELFSAVEDGLGPEDGEKILPLKDLNFSMKDSCITAELTEENGVSTDLSIFLRSKEEETA